MTRLLTIAAFALALTSGIAVANPAPKGDACELVISTMDKPKVTANDCTQFEASARIPADTCGIYSTEELTLIKFSLDH
ncbi:MAG: hypothetical protein HKO95_17025 [Rhodobacteraceae bacterium]|nr:hypothetical protein [Alphaproteobacteria bacterium]MBT8476203.1 hypothetical protein [Alphaproteobacteria bacterium]NNF71492.1 hypothetical protein [Paracoccaceae bacterium]NNK68429.1 hypothetical protein [Paracoccaceae bacterium]